MKVIAISGSPRKQGNCNTLAERFLAAAKERGASTKLCWVNGLKKAKGCQHCGACKDKSERCVIKDDITPVLGLVEEADVVVYATPIYFGDASAQFKLAFDRHYAFFREDFSTRLKPGKQAVMILSQGQPEEEMFADVFMRYAAFFKFLGFARSESIRLCGGRNPGTAAGKPGLLAKVDKLAGEMVKA